MKILSLSTAEQCCSLAVAKAGTLVYEEFWSSRLTHSKRLMKMIEKALNDRAGINVDQIDLFMAAKGPGSFTGLRIGISIAQALAYSTGKPALGVSSLDGIAWRFADCQDPVCVMMDARRNEVYFAVYRFERGQLLSKSEERVAAPLEAVKFAGEGAIFAGTGSKAYQALIAEQAKQCSIASPFSDAVSASGMIRRLVSEPGFLENPGNILTPSYIRKSDAELQFVEKQG
mgnify:CR=1 FL=1